MPRSHLGIGAGKKIHMLYKSLIAAFVVSSGDALRIDGLNTRRAAVTSTRRPLDAEPGSRTSEVALRTQSTT